MKKKIITIIIASILTSITLLPNSNSLKLGYNNTVFYSASANIKLDSAIPVPSSGNLPGTNS